MSKYERAIFTLAIGTITAGSISAWLQESADNSSWTANDTAGAFSGCGGTNVSQTGLVTSNKTYTFEVKARDMTAGKRYVRLQVKEVNGSATIICVVPEGGAAHQKPASAGNDSSVVTNNVAT